jgi:hypothetical protein
MCCKSIDFIYDVAVADYRRINKNINTDVRQDLNIFNLRENKIAAELLRTYFKNTNLSNSSKDI